MYIVDFPNLQILRISNNPFKDIPLHYAKAETTRLLLYLREREIPEPESSSDNEIEAKDPTLDLSLTRFSM